MDTGHDLENSVRQSSLNQMAETRRRRRLMSQIVSEFCEVISYLCCYMFIATLYFYCLRHHISGKKTNGILDAFYFSASLVTYIGYGDFTPNNKIVMLFVSLFGLMGTFLFGLMLNMVVEIIFKLNKYFANQDETDLLEDNHKTSTFLFVFHMGVGTFALHFIERMGYIHAIFCITSTITSIHSDGCFMTKGGRIFSLFWMATGTLFLGHLLFTAMETKTKERRLSLPTLVPERRTTRADSDDDDDGDLVQAEYILLKLEEMGRFSQEDIEPIIQEFKKLDAKKK